MNRSGAEGIRDSGLDFVKGGLRIFTGEFRERARFADPRLCKTISAGPFSVNLVICVIFISVLQHDECGSQEFRRNSGDFIMRCFIDRTPAFFLNI